MAEEEMEAAGETEQEVEEEFAVWKKNTPLLYDLVVCHALEWPSLTVQWLPSPIADDGAFAVHKLILGTHTSDDCPNFLMVANVHLPRNPASGLEHNLMNPQIPKVNYLSFNLYTEWVLATASSDSTVGLFDMRKLSSPLHVFGSHTDEVFQVEWDPNHETVLASSGGDRRLMVWDLNRIGDEQLEGEAEDGPSELLFSHGGHKAKISDFSWNKNEPWVISSVAEDNCVQVWQMAESIYREDYDNGDC